MEQYEYSGLCELIKNLKGERKLVLRYKSAKFEQCLMRNVGLKADFYVSHLESRINNEDVFGEDTIMGKSKDFLLVVTEEKPYNVSDADRYTRGGYIEGVDIIWVSNKGKMVNYMGGDKNYVDCYDNIIESKTNVKVNFKGHNSKVLIGKCTGFTKKL